VGKGAWSGQADVVLHDSNAAALVDFSSHKVLAGDSVLGIIEVKSVLRASDLRQAYNQLIDAKAATSAAQNVQRAGTWVVAFRGSSLGSLRPVIEAEHASRPDARQHWIDGVWILGVGGIVWVEPNNRLCPQPNGGARLRAIKSADTLFLMLWLMTDRLRNRVPSVPNLLDYAGLKDAWEFLD
jgi:hypothetical protein